MRGQISLEFTIIILAFLVAVVITTMGPGLYGMDKSVKSASASLAHAAMSKLKTNIELLALSDEGSSKVVYIKSPPGTWKVDGKTITFIGNGYSITATCSIDIVANKDYQTGMNVVPINLTRRDNYVEIDFP
ncbi:class III signal peptide-containing protein [Methanotorris formicicus]|uniref:Class III signal peptide-containing protein n=1 Tax=Methanotorris formicicus Mc-S-70 TaxID=647171 RepID=H1KYY7_9EURY|nr:class III signal peptide-containing protein [Methanotorris formicicus]EHP86567.1 protein of unknown function DUF361 [Methanotorris formicicus Mc-S-70]